MTTDGSPADAPELLTAEFVFEARVTLATQISIGAAQYGERRLVPITGGDFAGPQLRGEVLPGGADWQLTRRDGVTELDARYTLRASDATLIHVRNRGIGLLRKSETAPPSLYIRTVPQFEVADGPHAWLNTTLFLGTVALAGPGCVTVRFYRVL